MVCRLDTRKPVDDPRLPHVACIGNLNRHVELTGQRAPRVRYADSAAVQKLRPDLLRLQLGKRVITRPVQAYSDGLPGCGNNLEYDVL